ncbi:MAG: peptide ABC transporter substrate-binding protein [Candidatus Eremiobacteraeota bacterium]|nr:peptide ABC transporter substrate-binding protein [Candidatus Eremiobacteraeota bacterium]
MKLLKILALCAFLTACHSAGLSSVPSSLVVAVAQEPQSLNTILLEGPSVATIDPLVYSYLLTFDDRGNLVPDLATEVPTLRNGGISSDGLTIVYHLRKGVVWQDGAPLTADDVVFTQHAIMNRANNVYDRYGFDKVQAIEAPDPLTVRIHLKAPLSPILTEFFAPANNYGILPAHVLGRYANLNHVAFNALPIGSGPYRVEKWERGDRVVLKANPSYFRGRPQIPQIVLKFLPDSNTVFGQISTGEVNANFFSDPAHLHAFELPGLLITRAPFAAFGDLLFNVSSPQMADPAVRRAFVRALDVARIASNATQGAQTSENPNRALYAQYTDPSIAPPAYDPARARAVLAPRHLSLVYIYESGKPVSASVGLQIEQQLRAAGVEVSLKAFSPQMFRALGSAGGPLFGGKFDVAFFEVFTTGDADVSWYLGCDAMPPGGFNVTRFCDPAADRAMKALNQNYDPAVQRRESTIVQRRIAQLVPFVSLWSDNAIYVTPAALHGFAPSPVSPYWNAWAWSLR